jgi:hypothetical protein
MPVNEQTTTPYVVAVDRKRIGAMRDIKELIGMIMRVADGAEVTEDEVLDLEFDGDGELSVALNKAYIGLLEFAHDRKIRAADRDAARIIGGDRQAVRHAALADCSPHGAKRDAGAAVPDCAALRPGYRPVADRLAFGGCFLSNKRVMAPGRDEVSAGWASMSQYKVMVDDNFHYMEEDERWEFGTFATAPDALAVCRNLVDGSLTDCHKRGMTASDLYDRYLSFGDEPFVVAAAGAPPVDFSARAYAQDRAAALCGAGPLAWLRRAWIRVRTRRLYAGRSK